MEIKYLSLLETLEIELLKLAQEIVRAGFDAQTSQITVSEKSYKKLNEQANDLMKNIRKIKASLYWIDMKGK